MNRPGVIPVLAAALALMPSPARAQKDTFLQGVAELTAAVADSGDTDRRRMAAVDRMAAGLAEWDRALRALETRMDAEIRTALPERVGQLREALGLMYLERGRLPDAIRELDEAIRIDPRKADLHAVRGLALVELGRHEDGNRAFRTALGLAPDDPIKAYYALQRAESLEPAEVERARGVMRDAYRALVTQTRGARPFFTIGALPDDVSNVPVLADGATREGYALLARHEYDNAVDALRRTAAGGSDARADSPIAHFTLGRTYEREHRISDARREYEAAIAGGLAGRSALYRGIGQLARIEGDFARAIEAFEQAARLSPNDFASHSDLGLAYMEQERIDEAFREFVAALLIAPGEAATHAAIGRIALERGGHEDAITALTRALQLKPTMYETRYALGTALTRVGRTAEAAREFAAFERGQREALETRRRDMAAGVQQEEVLRERISKPEPAR